MKGSPKKTFVFLTGAELRDIQKLIDGLQNPHDPKEVASLLLLRREVMILQFDAAVRYLIRYVAM